MTAIEELMTRNKELGLEKESRPAEPALRVAILSCMDARIDVAATFGLRDGEAHVMRNAGGVVTDDMIRSLALSQHKLGTREVMIMQHTGCGVSAVTEDGFKDELESATGLRPTWSVEAFTDVEDSVRRSMNRVRRSDFLPHTDQVRGFVYDINTGALSEVS
ncbi:beta-class carbonic anhydrase [Haloechinothrix halophila]|uniref:beta-class carbonic anhydrase n=1 Tax=Haloechinothrix halophila TaxID=1069073 RepID=UPI000412B018|nr:carbonic anhydrase [Haloechinothrix halophila]